MTLTTNPYMLLESCRFCGNLTIYTFRICRSCLRGVYFTVCSPLGTDCQIVAMVESEIAGGRPDQVHIAWVDDFDTARHIIDDVIGPEVGDPYHG